MMLRSPRCNTKLEWDASKVLISKQRGHRGRVCRVVRFNFCITAMQSKRDSKACLVVKSKQGRVGTIEAVACRTERRLASKYRPS